MFDLTGKAALVTGASGGIGGAIARALHQRGATVVLSGTRVEALQGLATELGARAHTIACNLGDATATEKLVGEAEAAMGKLDILVNNAGPTRDMLARMKDEDCSRCWMWTSRPGSGWRGPRFGHDEATLRAHRGDHFDRGVTGNPGQANYAAAKAGMIGMSKALAAEVASRASPSTAWRPASSPRR